MIRLTWRVEGGTQVASVSLVDGRVLDNWGRTSSMGRPQQPAQPEPQPESRTR